jgi:hypothetical protein
MHSLQGWGRYARTGHNAEKRHRMDTKRTLLLVLLLLAGLWAGAQDRDAVACILKTTSTWGTPCEKCEIYDGFKRDHSGTFQFQLRNMCNELVDVKVAVQERSGTWRTFPVKTLAPNESMDAFACQGTGKYLYWVRRTNDPEIVLPSDREILTEYRSR